MKKALLIGLGCAALIVGVCASTYAAYQTTINDVAGGTITTRTFNVQERVDNASTPEKVNNKTIKVGEKEVYSFFLTSTGSHQYSTYDVSITVDNLSGATPTVVVGTESFSPTGFVGDSALFTISGFFDYVTTTKTLVFKVNLYNSTSSVIDSSNTKVSIETSETTIVPITKYNYLYETSLTDNKNIDFKTLKVEYNSDSSSYDTRAYYKNDNISSSELALAKKDYDGEEYICLDTTKNKEVNSPENSTLTIAVPQKISTVDSTIVIRFKNNGTSNFDYTSFLTNSSYVSNLKQYFDRVIFDFGDVVPTYPQYMNFTDEVLFKTTSSVTFQNDNQASHQVPTGTYNIGLYTEGTFNAESVTFWSKFNVYSSTKALIRASTFKESLNVTSAGIEVANGTPYFTKDVTFNSGSYVNIYNGQFMSKLNITSTGTSRGDGVFFQGSNIYFANDVTVDSVSRILSSSASFRGNIDFKSKDSITFENSGLYISGNANIDAGGNVSIAPGTFRGITTVKAGGTLTISGSIYFSNIATLTSTGKLSIGNGNDFTNDLIISGADKVYVSNDNYFGGDVTIESKDLLTISGYNTFKGVVDLTVHNGLTTPNNNYFAQAVNIKSEDTSAKFDLNDTQINDSVVFTLDNYINANYNFVLQRMSGNGVKNIVFVIPTTEAVSIDITNKNYNKYINLADNVTESDDATTKITFDNQSNKVDYKVTIETL